MCLQYYNNNGKIPESKNEGGDLYLSKFSRFDVGLF